ncbi:MAG: helix-turn-helix transcriptional regulator [Microbacteriaceae bacterium]|nr:helix-turn-helix transcriptional regulator [Microbacteriaceae bacterium]MDR9443969.1 helix-turn-helix transcriptional regulator [Microbacteriaceae bacterium]
MSRKPKEELERIGSAVESFREKADLSRQQLADEVGVHYQTIGYIERGEYAPSLILALKLAEALDASVEDIFWLEEKHE